MRKTLSEPVQYVSTIKELHVRLKPIERRIINGKQERIPGLRAQFRNFNFVTRDAEIVESLDALLNGESALFWRKQFMKRLPDGVAKKLAAAAEAGRKAQEAALRKSLSKEQQKDSVDFERFMKNFRERTGQSEPAHVKGTRSKEDVKPGEAPIQQGEGADSDGSKGGYGN